MVETVSLIRAEFLVLAIALGDKIEILALIRYTIINKFSRLKCQQIEIITDLWIRTVSVGSNFLLEGIRWRHMSIKYCSSDRYRLKRVPSYVSLLIHLLRTGCCVTASDTSRSTLRGET